MNIKDIARLSGVGVSTVSRVINNHPDVKQSTREKVLQIIKDSNYIPNNSARILKQNNTKNIGVLVKGVFNPFFSEMTNIIGNIIEENGYTMILQQNDFNLYQDVETMIGFVKEKRLQGVICLGGNFTEIQEDSFEDIKVPVVLTSVNTISKKGKKYYSSVGIDNSKSAYKAVRYLIEKGHKKIALVLGEVNDLGVSWWRLDGYKKALEENNIDVDDELIISGEYNSGTAYENVNKLLKKRKDITAIFALSDIMALGAIKAAIDNGFDVPRDISIVGFDGMDESKYYNPSITTVKQPKKKMAETSVELLFSLITTDCENKHLILDTKLVERDSCFNI
ncbi:LacI family DNA-binding transcriptional regulator [Clostridium butyricum]|uniref:LacI family DNA-binding transcriptional regulator n=1 Tax=Clostridium butyricum TaxID=1492 RepID=UPI002913239F|nr:LacI family transcriptional regulator [Clostridium butyricum]MDU5723623.1 LacI family DNA-binding transcriptional regulator [Clostridium butyricum]MDU5819775.1 LacI family DNA-binding transcriptional regulator [Clostridium butyricum]